MDPVHKVWLFENWLEDQNNKMELAKNHAYLLASFSHPEAVKKLVGDDNNQIESTDEEFEESFDMVRKFNKDKKDKKKRRRKLKE